jgi:hypothetical protein
MAWTYFQCNGLLMSEDRKTTLHCYAGIDEAKNNPDLQHVHMKGPLPRGLYTANEPEYGGAHGPFSMRLTPHPDNEMCGRDAFMYHADSIAHPGRASNGCIVSIGVPPRVTGRSERETFWNSGDHVIDVRSGLSERLI